MMMKPTFLIAFLFLMFLPGLALSEPITTQEFTVKANCAQPREGIELAFDQNPETIWHTPWGEPGKYPFQVEVTFRKPEVVEKIWYLPRQKGVNGILRRYKLFVKKGTDDKWVRVRSSVLSPTPDAQYITMEPTMCTALRLDILEGIAGFASAAEFVIFRPDTAFSELSNVSEKLAKGKWVKVPVFRRPSAVVERQRRGGGFDWSDLQPTGLAVKEGAKFTVWLDADLKGPLPLMGLCKSEKQASITLAPGENVLEAPFDGILYVKNPFDATEQKTLPKIYISGAKPIPLFRLGKTDEEEWRKMLEGKNPVGLAELSSKRILMTFSVENVKKYVDSPAKILKEYEYLMAVYAKLMGFDEETDSPDAKPTVHTRPRCRMRLIEVDHGHMFATFGYTAYHFGAVEPVLNSEKFFSNGWGPWHEIGHEHQLDQYEFQGMTEVTVNIFSLEMQTSLGHTARIDTPEMKAKLTEYFEKPDRDYLAEQDVFMKVALFWQLRLAFGPDFYPRLHRAYREMPMPETDAAKIQTFIEKASEISGRNLEPFFEAWGLKADPKALEKMRKLPKLEKPIWLNFEFSDLKSNLLVD